MSLNIGKSNDSVDNIEDRKSIMPIKSAIGGICRWD